MCLELFVGGVDPKSIQTPRSTLFSSSSLRGVLALRQPIARTLTVAVVAAVALG